MINLHEKIIVLEEAMKREWIKMLHRSPIFDGDGGVKKAKLGCLIIPIKTLLKVREDGIL